MTYDVRKVLGEIMKIDQDNYPETLGHICIINAPALFRAVWSLVRPMLNARTQGKIEVCFLSAGGIHGLLLCMLTAQSWHVKSMCSLCVERKLVVSCDHVQVRQASKRKPSLEGADCLRISASRTCILHHTWHGQDDGL
jgi:hypothetical protein